MKTTYYAWGATGMRQVDPKDVSTAFVQERDVEQLRAEVERLLARVADLEFEAFAKDSGIGHLSSLVEELRADVRRMRGELTAERVREHEEHLSATVSVPVLDDRVADGSAGSRE